MRNQTLPAGLKKRPPRSEAFRAKGNHMRTLVQPPPSSRCELCGGELRLKRVESGNSTFDLDKEIFVCAKCGHEQSCTVSHNHQASARQAPGKNPTEDNKVESSKIAGRQIDRMEDPRATSEEQASRKRRLLKGPKEFREMRGDLRKKKR
jgi:hypothetical protein